MGASTHRRAMKSAVLYRYALPMDSGVILRHTRLAVRDGFLLECRVGDKSGWGEIAPLPEFSLETLEQAQWQAQDVLTDWLQGNVIDLEALYPSVAFGFSVALAELNGDIPLAGNYRVAPLCSGDPDELIEKLPEMAGKKVAKIKVGMYEAIRDGMVVNILLEVQPDLTLRLDANRQWSPEKATKFAHYIHPNFRSRIAFLEEPCHTPSQSLAFSKETGIALAWDETLRDIDFDLGALERAAKEGLKAIVIKPTLIGSLEKVQTLVKKAHQLGIDAVISSSLESSFGLNQLARIADWLTPKTLPGLDTVTLFSAQLKTPWPECKLPLMSLCDRDIIWKQCL